MACGYLGRRNTRKGFGFSVWFLRYLFIPPVALSLFVLPAEDMPAQVDEMVWGCVRL